MADARLARPTGIRFAFIEVMDRAISSRGFSLIELMIVVAIITILASIGAAHLGESRMAANEASAIGSVRSLFSGEIVYASTEGSSQFGTLAQLEAADIIDSNLGSGSKAGYTFSLVPNGSINFTVTAVPDSFGLTGRRGFYIDATGVIRFTKDGTPPDATSPPLQQ